MLYAQSQYGLFMYGDDSAQEEHGEAPSYYLDLEKHVPAFIQAMREFHELLTSWGYEAGLAEHYLQELAKQFFVDTATWGLTYWEAEYGIRASEGETYEVRRANVIAAMAAAKTCTADLLKNLAETYTGVETQVIEESPLHRFILYFIGKYGVVPNTVQLKRAVDTIKPAHLDYEIRYRYVIWDELRPYTWDNLRPYTWDGLRVMQIRRRVTWHGVTNAGFTWKSLGRYRWRQIKNIEEAKE